MVIRHAENPAHNEYTMCGLAFDAHDSGDLEEEIVSAVDGEPVTCQECRRVVLEVRKIKLGRMPETK